MKADDMSNYDICDLLIRVFFPEVPDYARSGKMTKPEMARNLYRISVLTRAHPKGWRWIPGVWET
jgi:hypothetical protein